MLTLRTRAALGALGVAAAGLAPLLAPSAALATPDSADRRAAEAGAGWLARQIIATGGYVKGVNGKPSVPDTVDALLALHAAGVGKTADAKARGWLLAGQWSTAVPGQDGDNPGVLAKLVLLAHAAGMNPRDFAGQPGDADDLVARLKATRQPSGLFGAAKADYDGAFRQGLALAALAAAGEQAGDEPEAIGWLIGQQCAEGSWMALRPDPTAACPAPNPAEYSGPDTNSTAMAITGLQAIGAGGTGSTTSAVSWLRKVQSDDGGWAYYTTGGAAKSDPNSTGLVLSALLAAGTDPAQLVKAGRTPGARLRAFQLGASGDAAGADAGAFWFDLGPDQPRKANVSATTQAVPALAGTFLPIAPGPLTEPAPLPAPTARPGAPAPSETTSSAPGGGTGTDSSPTLPATGAAPELAGAAVLLIAAGGLALLVTRRRPSQP